MTLLRTPLDSLHREFGAKMVSFAGYDMPVQYPTGIIKEHLHTREAAGLFDVSHMGQVIARGKGAATALEALVPGDIEGLGINCQLYTLMTNESGGVLDDLIVTRWGDEEFFLVLNAACKSADIEHLRAHLPDLTLSVLETQSLIALQGPAARAVMSELYAPAADLQFLTGCRAEIDGAEAYITCSGYTGEDGFEISLPGDASEGVARRLLAIDAVQPIGLGARDSLRLEAGLCLYGHELTTDIDPVQAGLVWTIGKARRPDGARPGGFPGAETIFAGMENKPPLARVGLKVESKRPVREGQVVLDESGRQVGEICSAAYGASVGGPVAMAYITRELAVPGTPLSVTVRDKQIPVSVSALPFNPHRYHRG